MWRNKKNVAKLLNERTHEILNQNHVDSL